jgi:hypothetical protein
LQLRGQSQGRAKISNCFRAEAVIGRIEQNGCKWYSVCHLAEGRADVPRELDPKMTVHIQGLFLASHTISQRNSSLSYISAFPASRTHLSKSEGVSPRFSFYPGILVVEKATPSDAIMDTTNDQADLAQYFDFGEASMPETPSALDGAATASPKRSSCPAHGDAFSDGYATHFLLIKSL